MRERIKQFLHKRGFVLSLSASLLVLIGLLVDVSASQKINYAQFQAVFLEQSGKQDQLLQAISHDWNSLSNKQFSKKYTTNEEGFFIHVYHADSLVYWNTNKCPINRFAEVHFPVNGLVKLQNGWYYTQFEQKENNLFAVSFGIKREFPITNKDLSDYFFNPFPSIQADVSQVITEGKFIKNQQDVPLFSLIENETNQLDGVSFLALFLVSLFVIWLVTFKLIKQIEKPIFLVFSSLIIIAIRIVALKFQLFSWMNNTELFDPGILGLNQWVPNFGELLVWFLTFLVLAQIISKLLSKPISTLETCLGLFAIPILILLYPQLVRTLIINSTIPIHLSDLLNLNLYSGLLIGMIGISTFILFQYFVKIIQHLQAKSYGNKYVLLATGLIVLLVILINEWVFRLHGFWVIWMFSLLALVVCSLLLKLQRWSFSWSLLFLFVLSLGITLNLEREAKKKEREERLLFANQLADDRDMNAEVDFIQAREKLLAEPFLKRLFKAETAPSFSELKEAMEYRVFNGYWDRYDVDFYFYLTDSSSVRVNGMYQHQLEELIAVHGEKSEVDSNLVYIRDYTSQFNYVFFLPLERDGVKVHFYGTLKSKRIPEKIGFPRLLVSKQTAVYQLLEGYSIAKYYNNQLVLNYGKYSFPTDLTLFGDKDNGGYQWLQRSGFEHLIFKKSKTDAIILTKELPSTFSYLTSTAFLMVCFGTSLLCYLVISRAGNMKNRSGVSMVSKIQLVLVGLIVASLIGFSLSSSTLLSNQYRTYSKDQIRDRVKSVINEIQSRQRFISEKFSDKNQDELDYQLRRWSKVFSVDINLFQHDGILAGTSRTKIYNMGLLSEQMNSQALYALVYGKKSEFIHEENIGSLIYLSGYVPVFNHDHELLGYLNILHFDQHNLFEEQLRQFFAGMLNVFMFLLILTIVVALFASSWITRPLVLLSNSFSRVEFGKNNARIDYDGKDEIGSLVAEYNLKLEELATAANKLAQSERESAWREMAKQVAHEIKNPLTPMKLSVQHLQRVFDPSDPKMGERIERVTNSLIEQIDALTNIANEFSNFAKLPQPKMTEVDVVELCRKVVALFDENERVSVNLQLKKLDSVVVFADRELLLRVLNNLVTNGIQAVRLADDAQIVIAIEAKNGFVWIRISDNGCGIEESQIQKIFEPYFTTKSTGTGLGLAMVRQIVESHHGTVEIESSNEGGTTVLVVLPCV